MRRLGDKALILCFVREVPDTQLGEWVGMHRVRSCGWEKNDLAVLRISSPFRRRAGFSQLYHT